MSASYRSHPFFMHVGIALSRTLTALLIAAWLIPLMAVASGIPFSMAVLRVPVTISVSLLVAGMLIRASLRDTRMVCFRITDKEITKDTASTKQILPFSGVLAFDYRRLPIVLGRGYLRAPSGSMSLPLTLANTPDLIDTLRMSLLQENKAQILANPAVEQYLRDAAVVSRALDRFARQMRTALRVSVGAFISGILIARFFWDFYALWALLWGGLSALFPIAGYLCTNSWIAGREIRTGAGVDEEKVLVVVGGVTLIAYLLSGIIASQTW